MLVSKSKQQCDRFIKNIQQCEYGIDTQIGSSYKELLYRACRQQHGNQSFMEQINELHENMHNSPLIQPRQISSVPDKILDAPDILDDFYLNILEWGENNLLAVGLSDKLYLWNAANAHIEQLSTQSNALVTSVHWISKQLLAVGFEDASLQIIDIGTQQTVNKLLCRTLLQFQKKTLKRSSAESVSDIKYMGVVVEFREGQQHLQSRFKGTQPQQEIDQNLFLFEKIDIISIFEQHTQEVCGLKWQNQTLASGANDNQLLLWDRRTMQLRTSCEGHNAAVKALNWCPWLQSVLVSGGGSNDKTIKVWNADSGSQVCSIQFLPKYKEMISSHGFSKFQISIWQTDNFQSSPKIIQDLQGHQSRVLHLGLSPDQTTLCSAAGDETLRFWKLCSSDSHSAEKDKNTTCNSKNYHLR